MNDDHMATAAARPMVEAPAVMGFLPPALYTPPGIGHLTRVAWMPAPPIVLGRGQRPVHRRVQSAALTPSTSGPCSEGGRGARLACLQ